MRAGLQEQQRQFHVVLPPSHQPVRLYMALPRLLPLIDEFMGTILGGQRASCSEQSNCIENQLQVKTSLLAALQVFVEAFGSTNTIHCYCVVC